MFTPSAPDHAGPGHKGYVRRLMCLAVAVTVAVVGCVAALDVTGQPSTRSNLTPAEPAPISVPIPAPNVTDGATVQTAQASDLTALLVSHGLAADANGDRVSVHGSSKAAVSQIAFDHRIRVVELTETSRSLEDTLLDMTGSSTEFASA